MARGSKRRRGRSWELRVSYQGKRATRTIPDCPAKDADRQLRRFLDEVEGRNPDAGSVADLLDRWLTTGRRRWSPSTVAYRESVVRTWLRPNLGGIAVAALRTEDIDDLLEVAGHTLAVRSVKDLHGATSAALGYAVKLRWRADNPAKAATVPKVPKVIPRPPPPTVVNALVAAIGDTPLGVYILLAALTGARRGELVALQWPEVDIDGRIVTFAYSLAQPARGRPVRKSTKTDRIRRVTLWPLAAVALTRHRERMETQAAMDGRTPGPWLFSEDPAGDTPWRPDGASSRFNRLRTKVPGAEKVSINDLRHYVATELISSGHDPVAVAAILGHRRPSMTLDVYAAFVPARGSDAIDHLGSVTFPQLPAST
jgi:integrase